MAYLTLEDVMAFKSPEPLEEVFHLESLGGDVKIQGITKKAGLEAINAKVSHMSKMVLPVEHPVTKETYQPDPGDIRAACWISACVVEPQLTPLQWLQFAAEGVGVLGEILARVYVCCRLIKDADTPEGEGVPDGTEAAKLEIKEDEDPLVTGGAPSA